MTYGGGTSWPWIMNTMKNAWIAGWQSEVNQFYQQVLHIGTQIPWQMLIVGLHSEPNQYYLAGDEAYATQKC